MTIIIFILICLTQLCATYLQPYQYVTLNQATEGRIAKFNYH